jgi:flagellar hook-basal body complex protein FliE
MPVEGIGAAGGMPAVGNDWRIGSATGGEWQVDSPVGPAETGAPSSGFGASLANQLEGLQATQDQAAGASQALATGTADDVSSVVMSVERARLAMQLASQLRTKGVEAFQDIFHTQV